MKLPPDTDEIMSTSSSKRRCLLPMLILVSRNFFRTPYDNAAERVPPPENAINKESSSDRWFFDSEPNADNSELDLAFRGSFIFGEVTLQALRNSPLKIMYSGLAVNIFLMRLSVVICDIVVKVVS